MLRTNRIAVGVLITAAIVIAVAAIVRGTSRSRPYRSRAVSSSINSTRITGNRLPGSHREAFA